MFESLLRWMGTEEPPEEIPLSLTLNDLRDAGVDRGLITAWPTNTRTSTSTPRSTALGRYPERFVDYMRKSDCGRVLFGTNYPMIPPGECLEEVDELGLSKTARRRFLFENAAGVFDLDL